MRACAFTGVVGGLGGVGGVVERYKFLFLC